MNLEQIAAVACATVNVVDTDTLTVAAGFTRIRHQQIYEGFDWTAAQDIISQPVTSDNYAIELADAERVISARWVSAAGVTTFLDPISQTYLFESLPELIQELGLSHGIPKYYVARFLPSSQIMAIGITPIPDEDGNVILLIKRAFDRSSTEPLVPNIDEVLVAFVVSDLWEYLRQVANAVAKRQEAATLLQAAQQKDTPASPKPRTSKILSTTGATLGELADSVCQITGQWSPDFREGAKDRIRRNYAEMWDTLMLPESLVIANIPIDISQEQLVLPPYFDRIIEARLNASSSSVLSGSIFGPVAASTRLKQSEISYFFNVDYTIFERVGLPANYTMLPSVGVQVLPPFNEGLKIASSANSQGGNLTRHPHPNPDAGIKVFIKGESTGAEFSEEITILQGLTPGPGPTIDEDYWNSLATSVNTYDTPLTISKPETSGVITFFGATSQQELVSLQPKESERKCLRIWLLPNQNPQGARGNSTTPGGVLVLGKRRVSPLINELDSPQIRNVANILINAAAGDMFDRLGNADQGSKYSAKAAAQMQTLVDAETKQNAYQPVITPYVASDSDDVCW